MPMIPAASMIERKSPMVQTLQAFAHSIAEAERYRKTLRQNFGLSDQQIAMWTQARQPKRSPMRDYAEAVFAAKRRLEARRRAKEIST